jgi:hypothetical protein
VLSFGISVIQEFTVIDIAEHLVGFGYKVRFSRASLLSIEEEWFPDHPSKNQALPADVIGSIYCSYANRKIGFTQGVADEYGITMVLYFDDIDAVIYLQPEKNR